MKTGFFIPCYVDALAPQAADSALRLLQRFVPDIEVIEKATCCALPLADMGYRKKACGIEAGVSQYLDKYDRIIVPSGICTDQFRNLFNSAPDSDAVRHVRESVFEVVEFLHDILKVDSLPWAHFPHRVALHNGCHALRGLHEAKPTELVMPDYSKTANLLSLVDGIEIGYATRRDECCGFGGTFAIWDKEVSGQMGLDKVMDYYKNGLRYVTSADCSCLIHQQTVANKYNIPLKAYYIAEILNGDAI